MAYATILDSNSKTLVGGVELGREFKHVQVDEPIVEDERLVRERENCVTIGDAFASGVTIAWPSAFVCSFLNFVNLLLRFINFIYNCKFLSRLRRSMVET